MTINNSYNFGLLTDDGNGPSTSLQNLKSFTISYNSNTSQFSVINNLTGYEVLYYNTTQSTGGHGINYSGLVVFNKKGNNFIIMCDNAFQQFITSAQFLLFNSNGQNPNTNNSQIPSISTLFGYEAVTYPELPTFINGYNGYNIPNTVFTSNPTTYTFYIID